MNVKPGLMAIITGSIRTPEIVGRIVTVVAPAVNGELFTLLDGSPLQLKSSLPIPNWRIRAEGVPLKWRREYGIVSEAYEVPMYDMWLKPVSGLPIDEDVTDDLEIPA